MAKFIEHSFFFKCGSIDFISPPDEAPTRGLDIKGKNSNLIDHYGLLHIYEGALTHKLLLYSKPAGVAVLNGGGQGERGMVACIIG